MIFNFQKFTLELNQIANGEIIDLTRLVVTKGEEIYFERIESMFFVILIIELI